MKKYVDLDKQKCIVSITIEMPKRIFARDPKERIGNEKILQILKTEKPELKVLKFVKSGYCSNIDGEPNKCVWEIEVQNTWDDFPNKEKKIKNIQKLEVKEKNEAQLDKHRQHNVSNEKEES